MKKHLIASGLAIGTLLFCGGEALAGSFFVDTFSDPLGPTISQRVLLGTGFGNSGMDLETDLRPKQTIGGSRLLQADLLANPQGRNRAAQIQVVGQTPMIPTSGFFSIDNRFPEVQTQTTLIFDGNGMGLGAAGNLADRIGRNGAFSIGFLRVDDPSATFTFTLEDINGNMASVTQTGSGFMVGEPTLFRLSEFMMDNMNLDFSNIESIEFSTLSKGVTQIDFIQGLELPEPSMVVGSLCVLGLGLLTTKKRSSDNN